MKPTEEQIRELWEWCGLRYEQPYWLNDDCPEGTCAFYGEYYRELLGTITLNNLFKWAVPKLTKKGFHIETRTYSGEVKGIQGKCSWVAIQKELEEPIWFTSAELEDALFWAIYRIMEKG